jgi:hypothetical protein
LRFAAAADRDLAGQEERAPIDGPALYPLRARSGVVARIRASRITGNFYRRSTYVWTAAIA